MPDIRLWLTVDERGVIRGIRGLTEEGDEEGARRKALARRIAKAERRLARGIDKRAEGRGTVSERELLKRLRRKQERENRS